MKNRLSPQTNEECLQLTGSQINLTSRSQKNTPKSPKSSARWKPRPCSAFPSYNAHAECKSKWKRPMSADNDIQINRMVRDGSQYDPSLTGCSLSMEESIEGDPNFKHCYTYLSSKMLGSLIRNPWNSECSESVSVSSDASQSEKSLGCRIREMAQSNSDYSNDNSLEFIKNLDKDQRWKSYVNDSKELYNSERVSVPGENSLDGECAETAGEKSHRGDRLKTSELRDLKFQRWFPRIGKSGKSEEKIVRFSHEPREDDDMRSLINSEDEEDGSKEVTVLKSKAELDYNPELFIESNSASLPDDEPDDNVLVSSGEPLDAPTNGFEKSEQVYGKGLKEELDCEKNGNFQQDKDLEESKSCSADCPFSCCANNAPSRDDKKHSYESHSTVVECAEPNEGMSLQSCREKNTSTAESAFHSCSTENNLGDTEAVRDTTYDEIVSIINVLEQEETDSLLYEEEDRSPPHVTESKKSGELQEIYTYLDEVEKSSQETIKVAKSHLESVRTTTQSVLSSLPSIPRLEELMSKNVVELAHEVLSLKIQIEDQGSGIKLLQTTIAEMKEDAKIIKNNHQDEIFKITNDAEVAVQRHQKFIKQLLQEKKVLNEKVGKLVEDLKSGEERYQRNLKTIEQRHAIEIQRVKETQAVAEKLKREKWIDTKTQKIKEMTVKGLEPELSRMAARQQQELTELRNLHRAELEAVELRATRHTTELLDQLRSDLNKDKEEAILRETNALRGKLEKQFEEERNHLEHEARKLREEKRREKELLESKEVQLQDAYAEMKRSLEREKERERQRVIQEFQEQLETTKRRHQNEIKSVRDTVEIEKEAWMNNYKKQQSAKFLEREAELHHQYKQERDRDIELVIERLENEATQAQQEMSQSSESKFKRMKEKFEEEIKEMEETENTLKAKLSEAKSQLLLKDDQIAELKTEIHHLECDLSHLKKLCQEMSGERNNLKEIIGKEFQSQLMQSEKEQEELKNQIVTLKTNHILELAKKDQLAIQAKTEAKQELNQVYNRVKLTVNKKEEALEVLRQQHKTVLERCSHLEKMLENQRRNLLLK